MKKKSKAISECSFDFNLYRKALIALRQMIKNVQEGHKQPSLFHV